MTRSAKLFRKIKKHRGRYEADSPYSSRANPLRLDQADRPLAINPRLLGKPIQTPSEALSG